MYTRDASCFFIVQERGYSVPLLKRGIVGIVCTLKCRIWYMYGIFEHEVNEVGGMLLSQ